MARKNSKYIKNSSNTNTSAINNTNGPELLCLGISPKERFISACCRQHSYPSAHDERAADGTDDPPPTTYVPRQYYVRTGHIRQRLSVKSPCGVQVSNVTGITACTPPRLPVQTCMPQVAIRVPSMHNALLQGKMDLCGLDLCSIQQLKEPCPSLHCDDELGDFAGCCPLDSCCKSQSSCVSSKDCAPSACSVQCIPLEVCSIKCKLKWISVCVLYILTFIALLIIMCVNCLGSISIMSGIVLLLFLSIYDWIAASDPIHQLNDRDADLIRRLRTGRTALLSDLKAVGMVACAMCPCREAEESVFHILQECRLHAAERNSTWPCGADLHSKLYGQADELERTARFFDHIGRRVRLDNRMQGECCM